MVLLRRGARVERIVGVHITRAQQERADRGGLAWVAPLLAEAERWKARTEIFSDQDIAVGFAARRAERGVTAFLFNDVSNSDTRAVDLWRDEVPFAVMGRLMEPLPQSWVDLDNAGAIRIGLDHLAAQGHRRIGFVSSSAAGYWWDERTEGYATWCREHGQDPTAGFVRAPQHRISDYLADLLRGPNRLTAVMSAGDGTCLQAYDAARLAGLEVGGRGPDALAVVGFDPDLVLEPTLTTIEVDLGAVARVMWEQLASQAGWAGSRLWSGKAAGRFVACTLRVGDSG